MATHEHYKMYPAVLTEIENEREHQDHKWGGKEHDDHHTREDWLNIIDQISRDAILLPPADMNELRRKYVKIASVAIAAIEALYRTGKAH